MKFDRNTIFSFMLAAAFALTLAGCGGGGGTAEEPAPPMPTPEEMCTDAGNNYVDGECLTDAQVAFNMCVAGGGRDNGDDTCTSVADLMTEQRSAISTAIGDARSAVNAVDNDSTDAEVSAADTAIADARGAIAAAANLPEAEKDANTGTVDTLAHQLAGAKTARQTALDDAQKAADAAMAATAAKLHAGISPFATAGDAIRNVIYNTTNNSNIDVTIGTATAVVLTEDKDATVPAHHGWEGQKFTASPEGGGTYEAVVYSNVGEPTEGAKFSDTYTLTDGRTGDVTTLTGHATSRVASPSFDHSAGTKTFNLPDPNPGGATIINVAGSYQGVSGTYSCTPTTPADGCSVGVAASGFTLGGGTWTFMPTDPDARLMDVPDAIYASYGWWIHKSEDGETFTASAFAADRGDVPDATGITALQGTATYMGGAAGKYALRSMTGGTNDAGHFTATATLEADFGDDMITGTIDNFIGADGKSRDWSVKLNETDISDVGVIDGQDDASAEVGTVWTMDGTAGAKSGQWRGSLQNNGDDDVPMVGTGTFHSTFGADGNMVGAFGVNKQ